MRKPEDSIDTRRKLLDKWHRMFPPRPTGLPGRLSFDWVRDAYERGEISYVASKRAFYGIRYDISLWCLCDLLQIPKPEELQRWEDDGGPV